MEAEWTYYLDEQANRFGIRDERHEHIATIEGGGYRGKGTFENRARLIAAAPEMLRVLQHFFEWHSNHFEDFDADTNAELLCLANEAEAVMARTAVFA